MIYFKAFIIGGLLCAIAQILIDKTSLTPARILVSYVVAGVFLSFFGIFDYIKKFAECGATVPLLGFGDTLWNGVRDAVKEDGLIGIITGGLKASSAGISSSVIFGLIIALLFNSKPDHRAN